MSREDLIPFSDRTEEEQKRIRSKGGRTKSPARNLAAKLRWMKEKGLTDENAAKLHELMTNKELAHTDFENTMQAIYSKEMTKEEKMKWLKLQLEWLKTYHGTKQTIEHTGNMSNTIKMATTEELEEQLKKIKEKRK